MYRGQVTAVDAKGVYVLVPALHPSAPFGPLDHVGARPAVGALVLVADCGDESAPDLVVMTGSGPATSTDNAVARFDGTGGALQNSGVTIDDSNNVGVGDITTSKATATWRINATSGGASLYIDADAGQWGQVMFRKGTTRRWALWRDNTTESGSNAGSDLLLTRYDDAGSSLGTALQIFRNTGKVRIGAAGSTAGIELGAGGPTITAGPGAPSHSAPAGSVWLRTDGTASTTLYIRAAGAWSALS